MKAEHQRQSFPTLPSPSLFATEPKRVQVVDLATIQGNWNAVEQNGFNHLLHLRLAWVNGRFDTLFTDEPLQLKLYSPNR